MGTDTGHPPAGVGANGSRAINGVWGQVFLICMVSVQDPNGVGRLGIRWNGHIGSPNCGIKTVNLEKTDWKLLKLTSLNWPLTKIADQRDAADVKDLKATDTVSSVPFLPVWALPSQMGSTGLQEATKSLTRCHYNYNCWLDMTCYWSRS